MSLAIYLGINAVVIVIAFLILWRISVRLGDVTFVDSAWAMGMVLLAG